MLAVIGGYGSCDDFELTLSVTSVTSLALKETLTPTEFRLNEWHPVEHSLKTV